MADPPAPTTSPSVVLLTMARTVEAELSTALAEVGLTVSRLGLLGHISGVPGASFSELARMSNVTVQTVHGAIRGLVEAGLVRDATARAGAASALELTPRGHDTLRSAMRLVDRVDEHLFGAAADPVLREVGRAALAALGVDGVDPPPP